MQRHFPLRSFLPTCAAFFRFSYFTPRNRLNRRRVPRAGINPSSSRFLREQPSCCLGWKERMNPNRRKVYKQKEKGTPPTHRLITATGHSAKQQQTEGGSPRGHLEKPPEKEKNGLGGDTAHGGKFQKAEAPPSRFLPYLLLPRRWWRREGRGALLCHACLHHRSIKWGRGPPSRPPLCSLCRTANAAVVATILTHVVFNKVTYGGGKSPKRAAARSRTVRVDDDVCARARAAQFAQALRSPGQATIASKGEKAASEQIAATRC